MGKREREIGQRETGKLRKYLSIGNGKDKVAVWHLGNQKNSVIINSYKEVQSKVDFGQEIDEFHFEQVDFRILERYQGSEVKKLYQLFFPFDVSRSLKHRT